LVLKESKAGPDDIISGEVVYLIIGAADLNSSEECGSHVTLTDIKFLPTRQTRNRGLPL
jgi:hypothetical protein